MQFVVLAEEKWNKLFDMQLELLTLLKEIKARSPRPAFKTEYITALEFMAAVRIKRTKFDQLAQEGKVKVIRRGRKLYVPVSEVGRYFEEK